MACLASSQGARRPSGAGLDGLDVEAEAFQRPDNEGATGKLVLGGGMASGDAGAAVDDRSIARDSLGEALCAVARGTALRQ